ncbi:MAG TPA: hypothetical protein VF317_06190 [Dermatophilaceae bacterium]
MYCHGCSAAAKVAMQFDQDERARLTVAVKLKDQTSAGWITR